MENFITWLNMANRERWRHNWGKSVTRAPWTIKRACRSCRGSIVSFLFCGFAPSSKTILLSSSPCAIQVTRTFFQKISRLDSYNSRRIGTLVLTKISFQKEKPRKSFRCERWKIESNRRLNTVKLDEREREEEESIVIILFGVGCSSLNDIARVD